MPIIRLNHVQITVPKAAEEQARQSYCGVLGLQEIEKPESLKARGGFWVKIGEIQLHVSIEEGIDRNATKAHVAYEVDNLREWKQKLTAAGINMAESVPIPGYDRFEARDPFGNGSNLSRQTEEIQGVSNV